MPFWDGTTYSKEKVCRFIATKWDMHGISFILSYATVRSFNLQMEKFVPVLLTLTKTESSNEKWQASARQFKCRGIFKYPCIYNGNGVVM